MFGVAVGGVTHNMWIYQKKLEYPVNITVPDPKMAKLLFAQYGGPDSDMYAHKEMIVR